MLKSKRFEYGCLMADIPVKNWFKLVSDYIANEDIYGESDVGFGIENKPHVTILFGFHAKKGLGEEIRDSIICSKPFDITFSKISYFESTEYDVVKFEVKSETLVELNSWAKENFEHTSAFHNYIPHLTVAYVKKGKGKKYEKELKKSFTVSVKSLTFSYPDKNKLNWKLVNNENN